MKCTTIFVDIRFDISHCVVNFSEVIEEIFLAENAAHSLFHISVSVHVFASPLGFLDLCNLISVKERWQFILDHSIIFLIPSDMLILFSWEISISIVWFTTCTTLRSAKYSSVLNILLGNILTIMFELSTTQSINNSINSTRFTNCASLTSILTN